MGSMNFAKLKTPKILMRAALLLVGVGLLAYLVGSSVAASRLPEEFVRARQNAALTSQDIVDLTKLTSERLAEVNLLELKGDIVRALTVVADARTSNQAAYSKAFELTQDLQELAKSLGGVPSIAKQREGSEAVAIELSLVSEFIIYTQKVDTFLDALERAIRFNVESNRAAAAAALDEVNAKVVSINALNNAFRRAIGTFDAPEGE